MQIEHVSMHRDTKSIRQDLRSFRERLAHGEMQHIVSQTGVPQSSTSRILNGKFTIVNSNVRKICKYAGISVSGAVRTGSFQNITEQLLELWDGTAEMESALLELVTGLKHLRGIR